MDSLVPQTEIIKRIEEVVRTWQPELQIDSIVSLTPDASHRRYFRVRLESGLFPEVEAPSAVAMWFDSLACPEASGGRAVPSDQAYVELSYFLWNQGVAVPRLLLDARPSSLLLTEDLGDRQLAQIVFSGDRTGSEVGFEQAIQQIELLQRIPPKPDFFPFQRAFNAALYAKEAEEFIDYQLLPFKASNSVPEITRELIEELSAALDSLPRLLVHRDFHAWNLLVGERSQIRVIDFQDALLGTRCYDLVSLLNDRDMDSALGESLYRSLFQSYFRSQGSPPELVSEYLRVLLQRDLKVAGRFGKLVHVRGLPHYGQWIPGTLRRIGKVLAELSKDRNSCYRNAADALGPLFPDIATGLTQGLRLL